MQRGGLRVTARDDKAGGVLLEGGVHGVHIALSEPVREKQLGIARKSIVATGYEEFIDGCH